LAKLNGTGVVAAVERDLKLIEKEFKTIVVPFVAKHPSVFPSVLILGYYLPVLNSICNNCPTLPYDSLLSVLTAICKTYSHV